jgi:hypothetical protein
MPEIPVNIQSLNRMDENNEYKFFLQKFEFSMNEFDFIIKYNSL